MSPNQQHQNTEMKVKRLAPQPIEITHSLQGLGGTAPFTPAVQHQYTGSNTNEVPYTSTTNRVYYGHRN